MTLQKILTAGKDKRPSFMKIRKEWEVKPVQKIKPSDKVYTRKKKDWKKEASSQHQMKIECKSSDDSIWLYISAEKMRKVNIPEMTEVATEMMELSKGILHDIDLIAKMRKEEKYNINDIIMEASTPPYMELRLQLIFDIYGGFDEKRILSNMMLKKYGVKMDFF